MFPGLEAVSGPLLAVLKPEDHEGRAVARAIAGILKDLTWWLLLIFLVVEITFPTGEAAPHSLGSLIQATIVITACEIPNAFALFANGGIGQFFACFVNLSGLRTCHSFSWHGHPLPKLNPQTFTLRKPIVQDPAHQ